MQKSTTILGIIEMRQRGISYDDCCNRFHVGHSTIKRIMSRYNEIGKDLSALREMSPEEIETAFYPPENTRRKDESVMPDYSTIYDPERQLDYHVIEELSKCEWIDQGRNLVITGQTGSGKTYIANALCISALRQFKNVRYIRASQLIDDLKRDEALGTYRESLAQLAGYELLVIDDFGLMQLNLNQCRNLFEVLESRDPHKSTMVISQFPVNTWYDLFQEHTYADACLTRLLSNAYRLEMNGKNMRDLKPINQ